MEQQDRDMLIVINERQQVQMRNQETHIAETKLFYAEVVGKLNNHHDRILVIETKQKPPIAKFFGAIGTWFIGK